MTFNVYTVWWNEFVLLWKVHVASKDMIDSSACCDNTIDYIVCLIGAVGSTSKYNIVKNFLNSKMLDPYKVRGQGAH